MKARLAVLGLLGGCTSTPDVPPLTLDFAGNCNAVTVEAIAVDMDATPSPWESVLAAAHDGAGLESHWLLVSYRDDSDTPRLGIAHLTEGIVDVGLGLDVPPEEASTLRLQPGPEPGEVYVVQDAPGVFRLWAYDALAPNPFVAHAGQLGDFPNGVFTCEENGVPTVCDVSEWPRELVFLGGAPHIVSVPPYSLDASVSLWVGRLAPGLILIEQRQIKFEPVCDPTLPVEDYQACEAALAGVSHPSVDLRGIQSDPRPATSTLFLARETARDELFEPTQELMHITMGIGPDNGPSAVPITLSYPYSIRIQPGPPSGVALDASDSYIVHRVDDDEAHLLRFRTSTAFGSVLVYGLTNRGETMQLLQLDNDIAVGWFEGDVWSILKVFPDDLAQSQTTEYVASAPITRVVPAGPGAFLLHKTDRGPDLLRIYCAEPED